MSARPPAWRRAAWRRHLRFWGRDPTHDLDDELQFHLAARYDEFVAAGMPPDAARAAAARRFGDVEGVRRECAAIDARWERERAMSDRLHVLMGDLRYAVRQLRRNAALGAAAILCFALGIGANTAIFSVVDAVLFKPLPFPDADRIVLVGEGLPRFGSENFGVIAAPELTDYERLVGRGRPFTGAAIYGSDAVNVSGGAADPERVTALRASPALFTVLGVAPALGHGFVPADSDVGTPEVVVLGDALWRRRFGADPRIVGRAVNVDGRPATVVGVMPPTFRFPLPGIGGEPAELIVPYKFTPAVLLMRGNSYDAFLVARLAPDATLPAARRAVNDLATSLARLHPDAYPSDWKCVADAFPLRDRAVKDVRRALLVLLAAVAVVLLIACINVSALLLARASARHREIAARQALGASFGRLVQQFLAESLVLVAAGGALGVLVAVWGVRVLARHAPARVLDGFDASVDVRVLGVTAAVAFGTAVVFSLIPALSHRPRGALTAALRDEGARGGTAGMARQRGRRVLVVTEVAFALVLATLAGLMVRSFLRASHTDPGFDPEHVVTFRAGLPSARYGTPASVVQFEQRLVDALAQIPGVRDASATDNLPLGTPSRVSFSVEGATLPNVPIASSELVYAGYFETMRIRLERGRAFTRADVPGALPVAVVNEALARRYFGSGGAALGRRIKWGMPASRNPWLTVVGVTADVKEDGLDQPVLPTIYFPAPQQDTLVINGMLRGVSFVVRSASDDAATMAAVRRVVREADPELPIVGLRTMSDVIGVSVSERRFDTVLLGGFALVALALASIGIYGVVAFAVVQRTREIGVRIAIGATRRDVLRLVVGQGTRLAAVGVAFGLVGALVVSRLAATMLFEVSPIDPPTFVVSALLLLGVAALASAWPAVRAARIDPQQAIRVE